MTITHDELAEELTARPDGIPLVPNWPSAAAPLDEVRDMISQAMAGPAVEDWMVREEGLGIGDEGDRLVFALVYAESARSGMLIGSPEQWAEQVPLAPDAIRASLARLEEADLIARGVRKLWLERDGEIVTGVKPSMPDEPGVGWVVNLAAVDDAVEACPTYREGYYDAEYPGMPGSAHRAEWVPMDPDEGADEDWDWDEPKGAR